MTHLPYIIPSYVVAVALPLILALLAARRLAKAKRQLAQLEPRRRSGHE